MKPTGWTYGRFTKGCKARGNIQGFHFWHAFLTEIGWQDGCVSCYKQRRTPRKDIPMLEWNTKINN
jgi:hypothetical protein